MGAGVQAMSYKLLVVDIDGTLVGSDGSISAEDREALARVRQSRLAVSLSTGRVPNACREVIKQLSLDGCHVFSDGALVSDPIDGREVYVQPLNGIVVQRAVEFAHRNDICLELYSATEYFIERETWASEIRRQFFGIRPTVVNLSGLWKQERIIKGGLTAASPQEEAEAVRFSQDFDGRLHFSWAKTPAYPDIGFINILDPRVSKGRALKALASYLGVSLSEVIAIGDGVNDIPLLSTAGLAVAMQDAPDEVKAVADYVTHDIKHSGLAAAVHRFLL
ncbi:Cof-type HAD-IIB family hydrolase [Chloroflexota bacterium]